MKYESFKVIGSRKLNFDPSELNELINEKFEEKLVQMIF